ILIVVSILRPTPHCTSATPSPISTSHRHSLFRQNFTSRQNHLPQGHYSPSGKKQPARWSPRRTVSSGGSDSAQRGCALKQRVRKRHPLGGFTGETTSP